MGNSPRITYMDIRIRSLGPELDKKVERLAKGKGLNPTAWARCMLLGVLNTHRAPKWLLEEPQPQAVAPLSTTNGGTR